MIAARGLLPWSSWTRLLREAGFQARCIQDGPERDLFLALKPGPWNG